MSDDQVWKALSSPHRRTLLDVLRGGPRTTTELCEALPKLSRFAVMQHLSVLERAGIVLVRREGRERHNELNAVPIQRELERWLNSFQRATASQLLAFERHLQSSDRQQTDEEE